MANLRTVEEAYSLLHALGAPRALIAHARLVGEAGEALISAIDAFGIHYDRRLIRLGIAVHDAGKIQFPHEMSGSGSEHEAAGEALLLEQGVQTDVARCCRSHAGFDTMEVSLEELIVALADKLWKGKRHESLELRVIDALARHADRDRWELFTAMDAVFESIAADGDERLDRSRLNR